MIIMSLFIAKFRLVFIGIVIPTYWSNLVAFDVPLPINWDVKLARIDLPSSFICIWPYLVFKNDPFTDFVGD